MNLKTVKENHSNYIKGIDGLRALAVIVVIINHFNKNVLSGGFLGVDIFFVISGFVITSSLSNTSEKNFLNFLVDFYSRRIKRLIPNLVFFILPTVLLISFFNPEPIISLYTAMSSLFGLSNIFLFYTSTDYFGQAAELNPFTHTWSLGVEEQFYLFYPLIIWFSGYSRNFKNGVKNLLIAISFLFFASLFSFYYFYWNNHPASYFLITSRCWEIIAGCITFIISKKINKYYQNKISISSNISLILIFINLLIPNNLSYITTIIVVLITCNLLINVEQNLNKNLILNNRIFVGIGKMSYSLYLWHWGIISLSKWTIGMSLKTIPIQIILIFLISSFSYLYIENPIRKINKISKKNIYIAGFSSLGIIFIFINNFQKKYLEYFYLGEKPQTNLSIYAKKTSEQYRQLIFKESDKESDKICNPCHWTCGKINNLTISKCGNSNSYNKGNIWILGDSHTSYLQPAGAYIAKKLDFNLFIFGKAGTIFPSTPSKVHERYDGTLNKVNNLENEQKIGYDYLLNNFKSRDIVIISQRYPLYFGPDFENYYDTNKKFIKYYDQNTQLIDRERYYKLWLNEIKEFIEFANSKSVKVILIGPLPEFPDIYYRKNFSNCGKNWFNKPFNICKPEENKLSKSILSFIEAGGIYKSFYDDFYLLEDKFNNLKVINMFDLICNNKRCNYSINNINLYSDHNHISEYNSWEIFGPEIMNHIEKFTDR